MTDSGRWPVDGVVSHTEPSVRAGWVVFAGVMMVMLGVAGSLQGFVALFDEGYFLVGPSGLVVDVDYDVWGSLHLVLGLLVFGVGLRVLEGDGRARDVGVVLAVLSALVNIAFLAADPVWSTIMIALDVIVIHVLCVHGRGFGAY
jgi:hypothetical protein